jgi:CRP/FNR family transcriptional regulator
MASVAQSLVRNEIVTTRFGCRNCAVRGQALCSTLSGGGAASFKWMSHTRRVSAGRVIHDGHRELNWFAIIISGVVKLVKAHPDGRQQIVSLLFPADFVGRPYSGTGTLIVEAATDLLLCCFPRLAFENLASEQPALKQALLERTLNELDASRAWMFVLGRKTAQEKLASLLLLIAEQLTRGDGRWENAKSSLCFDLPLSRAEIADCLGLTNETVSRELRKLKSKGMLFTEGRRSVAIPSLAALGVVAGGGV